jgi:uncharacterized protein involved in exopolysaccharide biosynthesis
VTDITEGRVPPQSFGIDVVVGIVLSRWPMVLAFSILFGIAMTVLAFAMTPIYRGVTIVAPVEKKNMSMGSGLGSALGSAGGIASLVGLNLGGDYATEEAITVLKSRFFTEAFIQDNNLLPELFPKLWDSKADRWKSGIRKVPTLGKGFYAFDHIRKVERNTKTGLITLQIDWKDPVKAANWSNQLAERLNSEMRRRALAEAEASMGYLQKELAATVDVTTREAISRLMENQIKQEMLAHVTEEYALQVVDKAIPADVDDPVRPIKILYTAIGLLFGGMVGTTLALRLGKRDPRQKT